jgi:hypothetical protein
VTPGHKVRRVFLYGIYGTGLTLRPPLEIGLMSRGAFESSLASGLGERLAGETRAKNIVRGKLLDLEFSDIAVRLNAEILLVKSREILVDLARKNAFVAERGKRPVKTAKTGENVYEMQGGRQSNASN